MRFLTSAGVTAVALALSGCAIHQNVKPIVEPQDRNACIVSNPNTRDGFLLALKRSMTDKGFDVRQLPQDAALNACPIVVTYRANWRWDLAMYMSYAEINVYADAKPLGQAVYDSTRGGGNMGKFIDADKKVAELVTQLFPGGPKR